MSSKKLKEHIIKKEKYREEILQLSSKTQQKVAYHFNCPDGIISAVLIRFLFSDKELVFIPLDYALFKEREIIDKIADANWFAIVDLEPFHSNTAEYFFDHHISNIGKIIKSNNIYFVAGAPSTAYLIEKIFSDSLPEHLKELVRISKITDTASYEIPPPLGLLDNFSKLSWDEKIWFIEDICKSTFTIQEHDELIEILAFEGLEGLWKPELAHRVKNLRQSRKSSMEIAKEIEITDFVVIIDNPLHYNLTFVAREVQKRGAMGAAYITVYPTEVKISLRLNKKLSEEQKEKYRVDLLAQSMDGGGHKPAAGAETDNLEIVVEKIDSWARKKGLAISFVDLREK
ncbi:MAG: hypothetical protein HGN29_10420 [Asgard group archaeon]|nr:hypothetical protein [Asgard group archaeon]